MSRKAERMAIKRGQAEQRQAREVERVDRKTKINTIDDLEKQLKKYITKAAKKQEDLPGDLVELKRDSFPARLLPCRRRVIWHLTGGMYLTSDGMLSGAGLSFTVKEYAEKVRVHEYVSKDHRQSSIDFWPDQHFKIPTFQAIVNLTRAMA